MENNEEVKRKDEGRQEFSKKVRDIMHQYLGQDNVGHLNLRPLSPSLPPPLPNEELTSSPITVEAPIALMPQEGPAKVPPAAATSGRELAPPTARKRPPMAKNRMPKAVEAPVAPAAPKDARWLEFPQSSHYPDPETVGQYRILRIVSPTEIYIISEEDYKLEQERKEKDEKRLYVAKYFNSSDKFQRRINMLYKYYDKKTGMFLRVRLVDHFPDLKEVLIYFVDVLMTMRIVRATELKELSLYELNEPISTVYRCHLHDIAPLDNGHTWSPEACEHLKLLLKHKHSQSWTVLKMSSFKKPVYGKTLDIIHDMGVVMFSQDKTYPIESINYRLVDAGFAKAIGIGANPPKLPYFGGQMPYFNKNEGSFNPDLAPKFRDTIPHIVSFCMGQIKIDYVKSPDVIYVQELQIVEELRVMEDAIREYIEKKEISNIGWSEIESLQAVAALVWDNKNEVFHYHRAVVMDIAWNHIEILLVDYGNIMTVNSRKLFKMPEEFAIIPSYCHRVHLNTVKPSSSKDHVLSTWSKSFTQALIKKIKQLDERGKPAYFPLRPDPANTTDEMIHLTEINQRLNFDRNQNKWIAKEAVMDDEEKALFDEMKNNPLLKGHLASYGLEIIVIQNGFSHVDGVLWGPTYLVDHFMGPEINGMEVLKERYDKKDFYGKLFRGFDKFWEDIMKQRD